VTTNFIFVFQHFEYCFRFAINKHYYTKVRAKYEVRDYFLLLIIVSVSSLLWDDGAYYSDNLTSLNVSLLQPDEDYLQLFLLRMYTEIYCVYLWVFVTDEYTRTIPGAIGPYEKDNNNNNNIFNTHIVVFHNMFDPEKKSI